MVKQKTFEEEFEERWARQEAEDRRFRNRLILIFVLLYIVMAPIAVIFANYQYNYDVQKCDRMTSSASNYDFTQRVELNAQYTNNCFDLKNYAFSYINYIAIAVVAPIVVLLVIYLVTQLTHDITSSIGRL